METNASTPPTMTYDEVDLNFADSGRSFTGSVNQYWNNPITTNGTVTRKRCRLSLSERFDISLTRKMTAYLYDEWRDIMDYFWSITPVKHRDVVKLSITFFGARVEKIDDAEADPTSAKNIAFILDRDTPQNAYIEFKTCCNRICGRKGIRFTKSDAINHLNGTNRIEIANNANSLFLKPQYPYSPLSELIPTRDKPSGFLYGYITMASDLKPCHGRHHYYKQIRIRDSSLSWDADDLQIMIFGNDPPKFPNCRESDLIRIHRAQINYRPEKNVFQGLVALDSPYGLGCIVINGNLTIPNNQEAVKHSFSENYTFDALVDGYFIKYLKEACRLRQEQTNPDLVNLTDQNQAGHKVDIPNVLGVNRVPIKLLNEIQADDERVTILVMITVRMNIVEEKKEEEHEENDDMEMDKFSFYWVAMDGSRCVQNKSVLDIYTKEEDIDIRMNHNENEAMDAEDDNDGSEIWRCDNVYNDNETIMGSYVKILVKPDYQTAIQCYQDIPVGQWAMLINILYDKDTKQLIYDMHSQIDSKMTSATNEDIGRRQDLMYYHIYKETQLVSTVSSIVPHHQYQSLSSVRAILDCKDIHCRYKIRGKCIRFHPPNVEDFTKSGNGLQFVLWIKDASGDAIKVIFDGKEALQFFCMEQVGDLRDPKNAQPLEEIKESLKFIMNETSSMEICLRSYKPSTRNLILYKAIDTVLVK